MATASRSIAPWPSTRKRRGGAGRRPGARARSVAQLLDRLPRLGRFARALVVLEVDPFAVLVGRRYACAALKRAQVGLGTRAVLLLGGKLGLLGGGFVGGLLRVQLALAEGGFAVGRLAGGLALRVGGRGGRRRRCTAHR